MSLHKLFQFDLLKVSLVLIGISAWSDFVCANGWSICILPQICGLVHVGARFVAFVFGAAILAHPDRSTWLFDFLNNRNKITETNVIQQTNISLNKFVF